MSLVFPKPPSLNHIYGYTSHGGFARSYITKKGKDWFKEALQIISESDYQYLKEPISDQLEIHIDLYTRRNQDIDNILKPTLDSLGSYCFLCGTKCTSRTDCDCGKNMKVIVDDKNVFKLIANKHKIKSPEPERVEVSILTI